VDNEESLKSPTWGQQAVPLHLPQGSLCDNRRLATERESLTYGRRRAVLWHVCAIGQEEATERRIHPDKKRRGVCATSKLSYSLPGGEEHFQRLCGTGH